MDPEGGKKRAVETFVAILGASELTYVEASATQQSGDWIRSNERERPWVTNPLIFC